MGIRCSRQNSAAAFTLVEVVVVIAVVALLSAIIVPVVAKQIDEAKIGRAKNECGVIAAAVLQFYKDVGIPPYALGNGNVGLYILVSDTAVDADVPGTATQYGFAADGNDDWYDAGGSDAARVDIFDNHLNANNPKGVAGWYRTTGEFRWKGPYLPPIGMDPWGHPYICNIRGMHYLSTGQLCVVISAGPNGALDTTYPPASTSTAPTGDDVWATIETK